MGVDMVRIERESINFKLPKPLADALRAKAAELDRDRYQFGHRGTAPRPGFSSGYRRQCRNPSCSTRRTIKPPRQ
jgi:hypothetical protein